MPLLAERKTEKKLGLKKNGRSSRKNHSRGG
jgi:hypothetical protein